MNSSASAPPPPPPLVGNIPAKRLATQLPAEPPACVQNAMLTKDKKPFTYTPGGIDLSQIKSPRMAQRLERNKNSEGVTNQQRSPQPNNNAARPTGPSSISAMGTPVQVFPTGPPPPPPGPMKSTPAPPPPPPKNQLTPQTNGTKPSDRKSPLSFEPPPMGCRPEIKIPPNPMASLRKVPKPQEKNDFWIEEYRKERSTSPNVNPDLGLPNSSESNNFGYNQNNTMPITPTTSNPYQTMADKFDDPKPSVMEQRSTPVTNNNYNQQWNQPAMSQPNPYQNQMNYEPVNSYSPVRQQAFSPPPPPRTATVPITQPRQVNETPQQQWNNNVSSPPSVSHAPWRRPEHQRVDSPVTTQTNSLLQRPMSPMKPQPVRLNQRDASPGRTVSSPMQNNQPTSYYNRPNVAPAASYQQPTVQSSSNPLAPSFAERNANVGILYIPPLYSDQTNQNNVSQKVTPQSSGGNTPQTPAWLAKKPSSKDTPEWVNTSPEYRESNILPSSVNNTFNGSRQNNALNNQPQQSQQMSQPKERIITIQLEKTPTPTKTPMTPGFGGQTFFNNPQSRSFASPTTGYTSPTNNPNKFVDQGYDDFTTVSNPTSPATNNSRWSTQQSTVSTTQNNYSSSERVIPIQIETRGPTSNSPVVLQSNPRTLQHQNSWGNGAPNQSKSFRVLQQITDTSFDDDGTPAELQEPQFSRTLDIGGRNQMSDNERLFVNRVKNQGPSAADPTAPPGTMYSNKYDDTPKKYIHPSEQKVYEPKKYMGGNIPSRSFKILQAMTMPENAEQVSDNENYSHIYDPTTSDPIYVPESNPNISDQELSDYGPGSFTNIEELSHSYSQRNTPRIVVTPTPEDQVRIRYEEKKNREIVENFMDKNNTINLLSEKLENSNREKTNEFEFIRSKTPILTDDDLRILDRFSPVVVDERINDTYKGDENDDDSDSLNTSASEDSDTESNDDAVQEPFAPEMNDQTDSSTSSESDSESNDSESDEELDEDAEPSTPNFELSVPMRKRTESQNSKASTVSDSKTIENVLSSDSDDNENEDKENEVYLEPTVNVIMQINRSASNESRNLKAIVVEQDSDDEDNDNEVSVSFSLPSRANSVARITPSPSPYQSFDQVDSDSEVSVNVSIPLRKKNFETTKRRPMSDCFSYTFNYQKENENEEPQPIKEQLEESYQQFNEQPIENTFDYQINRDYRNYERSNDFNSVTNDDSYESYQSKTSAFNADVEYSQNSEFAIETQKDVEKLTESNHILQSESQNEIVYMEPVISRVYENSPIIFYDSVDYEQPEYMGNQQENYDQSIPVYQTEEKDYNETQNNDYQHNFNTSLDASSSLSSIETSNYITTDYYSMEKQKSEDKKLSVRDRIAAFENASFERCESETKEIIEQKDIKKLDDIKKSLFSSPSVTQRSSIEESEEDSGVNSDLSRHNISEVENETTESFPALRKLTPYQRAATHSRLFKLLQNDDTDDINEPMVSEQKSEPKRYNRKKIIHNVSVTRKQNPDAIKYAETLDERRQRLSLPLKMSTSIDTDNASSPPSPVSDINDQLVNELVQSLLLTNKNPQIKKIPMEKLQAAAKKVLEELDSTDNTISSSLDSTPAVTPQEIRGSNYQNLYSSYYDTWKQPDDSASARIANSRRTWATRCPRIPSSKNINRDLSRVSEIRESVTPESSPIPFNKSPIPFNR